MSDDRIVPFNPLNKEQLGKSVGQALLRQPARPLRELERFRGAGIYAIYYAGDFEPYEPIASRNRGGAFTAPIYVGKAEPSGARKGRTDSSTVSEALHKRLREHRDSVMAAEDLDIGDFHYRALVVDDTWIPLGESLLIAEFAPIWNNLIDGFGNHNPGSGRHAGLRPRWDVLHPGRNWAAKCKPRDETADQIAAEIRDYLRNNPPPDDTSLMMP